MSKTLTSEVRTRGYQQDPHYFITYPVAMSVEETIARIRANTPRTRAHRMRWLRWQVLATLRAGEPFVLHRKSFLTRGAAERYGQAWCEEVLRANERDIVAVQAYAAFGSVDLALRLSNSF